MTKRAAVIAAMTVSLMLIAALAVVIERNKPWVKVTYLTLFGDISQQKVLKAYQSKYIPEKKIVYTGPPSAFRATWAFRPSHALPVYPMPVVSDCDHDGIPEVYIGSYTLELTALNGQSGRTIWQWRLPFGVIGGRVVELADLDHDGREEVIVGSNITLPIRVYALKTGPVRGNSRLYWYKNISGDFLEGGLSVIPNVSRTGPLIVFATRDAPYSRGSFGVLKPNGDFLVGPFTGVDDCISRPAVGTLPASEQPAVVHGSHSYYGAYFGGRVIARGLLTGRELWSSGRIGDTGALNQQIADVDFDGKKEIIAYASDNLKKTHTFILDGATGRTRREVDWSLQGVIPSTKRLLVARNDQTECIDSSGRVLFAIPTISFGLTSGEANGVLVQLAYTNNTLVMNVFSAVSGKKMESFTTKVAVPEHLPVSDYGVFGAPPAQMAYLTAADTDNDGRWDLLLQIRDFVVNVRTPLRVVKGQNPMAPLSYRNTDNSGVLY